MKNMKKNPKQNIRKRLGYLTPNEKFKQIINQNSVAFAS